MSKKRKTDKTLPRIQLAKVTAGMNSTMSQFMFDLQTGEIRTYSAEGQGISFVQTSFDTGTISLDGTRINRILTSEPTVPSSKIVLKPDSFDTLISVDATPHKKGERWIVENRWVAVIVQLMPMPYTRDLMPKVAIIFDILGMRADAEKVGWWLAVEEIRAHPVYNPVHAAYNPNERVALIVDAHLQDHQKYNTNEVEVLPGWILPPGFVLCYAKDQSIGNSVFQQAIKKADSAGRQYLREHTIPKTNEYINAQPGEPFDKIKKITYSLYQLG